MILCKENEYMGPSLFLKSSPASLLFPCLLFAPEFTNPDLSVAFYASEIIVSSFPPPASYFTACLLLLDSPTPTCLWPFMFLKSSSPASLLQPHLSQPAFCSWNHQPPPLCGLFCSWNHHLQPPSLTLPPSLHISFTVIVHENPSVLQQFGDGILFILVNLTLDLCLQLSCAVYMCTHSHL